MHLASYPRSGVSVVIPDNWRAEQGASPLVASIASGNATVAIWPYRRTEPLPRSTASFRRARRELARPFTGGPGAFERLPARRDFALAPLADVGASALRWLGGADDPDLPGSSFVNA